MYTYIYTANLRTNIVDFRGFDSSIVLMLRGGIPGPIGNLPESLSQAILVGIISVGRLGVCRVCTYTYRVRRRLLNVYIERHERNTTTCLLLFSICACHPCAGAMLIFSVSFQV